MGWNEAKPETKTRLEARRGSLPVLTEMRALVGRGHRVWQMAESGPPAFNVNFT